MMMETSSSEVSRHKCLVYEGDPSEQLPVIVPLLIHGLKDDYRCLYLGNDQMIKMVGTALTGKGVDLERESRRKSLLFSSDRGHLDHGFDPKAMVDMLRALIDEALRDGFKGLCATGDMRWELGNDSNFEKVLEYEALLDQVFREKPLQGICQYHRDTVPARAVQDALLTHRSFYLGSALNSDNIFYMPPELHLDKDSREKHGEWMCQQISRILKAERKRDEALKALTVSEATQRHLAEELARSNQDLERRVRERTSELESLNKELEAFSYSVSHDLRAPLRAIDGFSLALEEDHGPLLGESGKGQIGRVRSGVKRMNDLIDGMLRLFRVVRQDLSRGTVDLSALSKEIGGRLARENPGRAVAFSVEDGLAVQGDGALLQTVMENLIGNAWKFTSKAAAPRIQVGSLREPGKTVYFVRDNGAGFDMANAKKLFGVFQRLHTETEFPGTGVGLATVQRIIVKHGGRLWAESSPGQGAAFHFTIGE